jgi:CRISPR-associated protein Csm3
MHIGAAKDFAPIGAVDSPFIRDPYTKRPIIPGSSLKGKIRTLLAKSYANSYVLNSIEDDNEIIQRMFGSATKNQVRAARLQFYDLSMTDESFQQFDVMEMDTYIGEIKFENVINRITSEAKPRQIERVPAGVEFAFRLIYNIEDPDQVVEDMQILTDGLRLLQMDYLGGHGSRGYGRVAFRDFHVELFSLQPEAVEDVNGQIQAIQDLLEGSSAI